MLLRFAVNADNFLYHLCLLNKYYYYFLNIGHHLNGFDQYNYEDFGEINLNCFRYQELCEFHL